MTDSFDIQLLGRRTHTHQKVRIRRFIGDLLAKLAPNIPLPPKFKHAREEAVYFRKLYEFNAVQHTEEDRMPAKKVGDMREYDFSESTLEGWHKTFTGNPESNIQWFVTPLIRRILESDPSIR